MKPLRVIALWAGGALLLAGVAMSYFDPHLIVTLANQVWACF
jgi:hypothetical protein